MTATRRAGLLGGLLVAGLVGAPLASCGPDGNYSSCGFAGGLCCGGAPLCRSGLTCVHSSCLILPIDASLDAKEPEHDAAGVCTPHATRCSGEGVETCSAEGQWGVAVACTTRTCASGACTGSTADAPSCPGADAGEVLCAPDAESCCTSEEVPAGSFYRGYDGVTTTSKAWPATVSGLQIDRYEITVGRLRQFVVAATAGWTPPTGSGIHTHLGGGKGLASPAGGYEAGWDASWTVNLPPNAASWNAELACDSSSPSWTPSPGANEALPANCLSWYAAYAFCIWDGGFLPSEAEWDYAAHGGAEQRVYPWSSPASSTAIACGEANFTGCAGADAGGASGVTPVGLDSPAGDGKWSHADLAGNVWEWTLDYLPPGDGYPVPCVDCATTAGAADTQPRTRHGGAYYEPTTAVSSSTRASYPSTSRSSSVGARCARSP